VGKGLRVIVLRDSPGMNVWQEGGQKLSAQK
jgi:hypothetical protein